MQLDIGSMFSLYNVDYDETEPQTDHTVTSFIVDGKSVPVCFDNGVPNKEERALDALIASAFLDARHCSYKMPCKA